MGEDSEIIYKLRPVKFFYKEDVDINRVKHINADGTDMKEYGLIAEEVDEIFPYLTIRKYDNPDKIHAVDYKLLTSLLLNEVQKLNKKVTDLQEKDVTIEDLRADNKKMKEIINSLIGRVKKLESHA